MTKPDILIVGGGIGGLSAALCFAQLDYPVRVFEQGRDDPGAGIQLSPNATRILHNLGLATALAELSAVPQGIEIRHWQSGALLNVTELGEVTRAKYGFPYYHIHRADLMQILHTAVAAQPSIQLDTNTRVSKIVQDMLPTGAPRVSVTAAGTEYHGTLLIGADGIKSLIRNALFGADAPRDTGNLAWRGLVPAERLPESLIRPVTTVWWGPHKHFVHYYVRQSQLVNCVGVVEKPSVEQPGAAAESWTEPGAPAEWKQDFANWHASIATLIDNIDPDACYQSALFDRHPMPHWSRGNITLLGDACHPTLPFMAQGAAMAIEDAAVLARCVAAGDSLDTSLKHYESLRRQRTAAVQKGSRQNARLYHATGAKGWLRDHCIKRLINKVGEARMDTLFSYDALRAGG